MTARRILVVEDEAPIRQMLAFNLTRAGFDVDEAEDCSTARQRIVDARPDLVLVDWMLPDGSGVELIRWLRRQDQFQQVPVLMLTARSQESDMITGLDSGADDYLTKPMSLRELNARIRALLRRPAQYEEKQDVLEYGPVSLNSRTHEVFVDGNVVELTKTEFKLLKLFIANPRKVFSREQILDSVWGLNAFLGDRTVDVHILRLRKILKPYGVDRMITTVRGSGYRLSEHTLN